MEWVQIAIGIGYFLLLLAVMAVLHGATLVGKDWYRRRVERRPPSPAAKPASAQRAA